MSNEFTEKYGFDAEEENSINEIRKSVKEKADYDLRQIYGVIERIKKAVKTDNKDEFGNSIEDWDKLSTKDLINLFSEGNSWNFYLTPIRMQAFIESSLAEIIYDYKYNMCIADPEVKGTVAQKNALAEMANIDENFAKTYRKMYTSYVTEVLKSFDSYLKRIERIINWRQTEERVKNPF